ncbi:hypothetical protein fugu_008574 [Takifugu bimaculatus]|uniref:Rab proteins geranylgeranyltransferase component A n=1 Tax=Takifugu bimaculatus TaxID=433685 RepID=A0A4Z2AY45_9TELE|nr:hypothetical protein fugu_008574 [Takifugu bimaculatus]
MAAEDLPSEFDVVILGTGLAESVAAAAFSRVGQRVLHVDRRSYYAANWASFTFNGLLNWIKQYHEECGPDELQDWSSLLEDGEEVIYLSNPDTASIKNLQVFCFTSHQRRNQRVCLTSEYDLSLHVNPAFAIFPCFFSLPGSGEEETQEREEEEEEEPKEVPEAPPAQGEEPEADQSQAELAKKRISYAQLVKEGRRFNIDLVSKLMYSRGSLVDLLIKSNVSRYAEFKNVTRILTYRQGKVEQQLGDNLEHFILHSIAMVTEHTPTEEGLASTRNFLQCLGRYGNTPFLFPVYGLGEIPQCFCRMCAVFGGIYCLRHSVSCLLVDKDTNRFISRAVLITDSSVLSSNSDQQSTSSKSEATPFELLMSFDFVDLVHLTCQSSGSAYEDLSPLVSRIFCTPDSPDQENCPSVLWCLYFNITDGSGLETEGHDLPSNVYMCSGPDGGLSHENAIKQAEAIFSKILPDEDFCPPAPNPEDIIYDGDATASAEGEDKEGEDKEGEDKEGEDKEGEKEDQDKLEEAVLTEETVQAEE